MRLTKRALFFFVTLLLSTALWAQESPSTERTKFQTRYGQPDIPGTFLFDFGFTRLSSYPDTLDHKFWPSRTASLFYYYDFQIAKSGFSFSPGIGFTFDRYDFKDHMTLDMPTGDTVQVVNLSVTQPTWDVNKSKLIVNYLEIPLELRWHSNPNNYRRSFYIGVGGKFSILIDHSTKVKYQIDDENFKIQNKKDLSLSKIRYGFLGRIGYKGISLFYYQSFSTIFEENKGPLFTDPFPVSFGITIRGF